MFETLLHKPVVNILIGITGSVSGGSLGAAIIILTVVVRLFLAPLSIKTLRSQQKLQELSDKTKALRDKHANDPAAQNAAILQLYKDHNVNPLSGCLPLLIQFPLIIALYKGFLSVLSGTYASLLYAFTPQPEQLVTTFVGIVLTAPNHLLAIIAGVAQFAQLWVSARYQAPSATPNPLQSKQFLILFPALVVVIGWNLPAGLSLYWAISTLLSIGEQHYARVTAGR
ncbi:MAG: YidC/Oxa1 family membrane protein insertase [Candidatus Paceibacterota bacterium]|nr:MAG: YidC/Oxa1 family membrane protein insertase [Candidatus Paceibacterota bacterium]